MATKQASQGGPIIIGDLSGDNKDLNGSESTTRSSNKSITNSNGGPLSESWRAEPLSGSEKSKVASIIKACTDHDLKKLAALSSTEGGFVEDEVRRMACASFQAQYLPPDADLSQGHYCSAQKTYWSRTPSGRTYQLTKMKLR